LLAVSRLVRLQCLRQSQRIFIWVTLVEHTATIRWLCRYLCSDKVPPDNNISRNVEEMDRFAMDRLSMWPKIYGNAIADIRGKGLLVIVEFQSEDIAKCVKDKCLTRGFFVTHTQDNGIKIFPAVNIRKDELEKSLLLSRVQLEAL
jgi:acetylornithine/succinyldiaminopimelate/putrescine aminotransferase